MTARPQLDFMIVSLPRSGSTWAANWLTTETTYCAHDPLYTAHFRDFDVGICEAAAGRRAGIACTGIGWLWPDWVNAHTARVLVLRRPLAEVQSSLQGIGWPQLPDYAETRLAQLSGRHVPYTDLFDPAKAEAIWAYLTGLPLDERRHRQLVQMRVEPQLDRLVTDPAVEARLVGEVG